ncbi:MAG: hypothetical protein KTR31_36570 [Myxococcales bacterium]|nr:hypothetical protein [Myxococcales bacterium]
MGLDDWIRRATDRANAVGGANTDGPVLLATAATVLQTRSRTPVGWSLERFAQRRCNVIFGENALVLRSSTVSLLALAWLTFLALSLYRALEQHNPLYLLIWPLGLIFLFQRRPYSRTIEYASVVEARAARVRSLLGTEHDVLALTMGSTTLHIVPTLRLDEALLKRLGVLD